MIFVVLMRVSMIFRKYCDEKQYGAAIRYERVLWEDDPMNPEHLINLAFLHLADDVKKAMSNVRFLYFLCSK